MNSIEGLWLFCNPGDYYGPPSLIKIEDGIIQNYKFIAEEDQVELQLVYTARTAEAFSDIQSKFINPDRLQLHIPGKRYISSGDGNEEITEDIYIINQYQRLRDTATQLNVEEILQLKISIAFIKKGAFISYGENLDSSVIQELNSRLNKKGVRMHLQRFEDTYFLAFWNDDDIESILPIVEINNSNIVLTGFSGFPSEHTGRVI